MMTFMPKRISLFALAFFATTFSLHAYTSNPYAPEERSPEKSSYQQKQLDRLETDPVEMNPIESEPVKDSPTEMDPINRDPVRTDTIKVDPVEDDPLKSKDTIEVDPIKDSPIETDSIKLDPMAYTSDDNLLLELELEELGLEESAFNDSELDELSALLESLPIDEEELAQLKLEEVKSPALESLIPKQNDDQLKKDQAKEPEQEPKSPPINQEKPPQQDEKKPEENQKTSQDKGETTPPSTKAANGIPPTKVEVEKEAKTPLPKENQTYLIRFNNVRMPVVLGFISKITGKNFIFDQEELDFRVTIVSNEPTTVRNTIAALLQELRVRGLSMIEVGNNFIIHRTKGIDSPAVVVKSGEQPPEEAEIITQVYHLVYANPSDMVTVIRPMLSEKAIVEAVPDTKHLIVTGLRENIERITTLISNIDQPATSLDVGEYQAINISITNAVAIAEQIMQPIASGNPLVFSPDTSNNLVYIVSTPIIVEKAINVLEKIDRSEEDLRSDYFRKTGGQKPGEFDGMTEEERQKLLEQLQQSRLDRSRFEEGPVGSLKATKFYLHKLQYRKGDQIQDALQRVAQSLLDTSADLENTDLVSTINSIQWIESSNSLVFTGTTESIAKVKELIDEIDVALPQVLIEVLILETTIDDALSFGVDLEARFSNSDATGGDSWLAANSPLDTVFNSALSNNTSDPEPFLSQTGFNWGVIGRKVTFGGLTFGTLGALVTALHTDTEADILLNPKIVVEDNTPAEFFVGINTRFQTSSIANDQGNIVTSNYEFRDVGSTLKVTPLIGNNGIVTLDIEQELSRTVNDTTAGTGTTTSGTSSTESSSTSSVTDVGPTTSKSTTITRVHIPDGFFLILSGQIRTETNLSRSQVPCLGGLPFLGGLFSQVRKTDQKRMLMLFLRPQIINIQDIDPVTRRQQNIWEEKKLVPNRFNYEVDEALDFLNLKHSFCDPERKW